MSRQAIARVEFDTTINQQDMCIGFTRTTEWSWENYGADADGNRGMMMLMVDSDEHSKIDVSWENEETGNAHNLIPFDELPTPWLKATVLTAVEAYMESHEAEVPEEPEHDYDDQGEDE